MHNPEGLIYVESGDELLTSVVEGSPMNDLSLAANAVLSNETLFPFRHGNYLEGVGVARQIAKESVIVNGKEQRVLVRQLGIQTPQGPVLTETIVGWGVPEYLSDKKRNTSFLGWVRADRIAIQSGPISSYSEWYGTQTDRKKRYGQWREGELKKKYQSGAVASNEQWLMKVLEAVHVRQETDRRGIYG